MHFYFFKSNGKLEHPLPLFFSVELKVIENKNHEAAQNMDQHILNRTTTEGYASLYSVSWSGV